MYLGRLVELWNDHTKFWIKFSSSNSVFKVKYESLVQNPEEIKNRIFKYLKLRSKNSFYNPNKVSQSEKFTKERLRYYTETKLDYLTKDDIISINSKLDKNLMIILKYNIL